MEEFIKLLSAFGVGAIIVKFLDIVWLQRMILNNERNKWKRDQKVNIYSKLAKDLISQEEWGKHARSPDLYKLLGEAFLLIENKNIKGDRFIFLTPLPHCDIS